MGEVDHDCGEVEGQISGDAAACEPDDGQRPGGPEKLTHPSERQAGVHVVRRSDRDHRVKRPRCERMRQEIADEVFDLAAPVRLSSQIDTRGVEVDGRHVLGDSQQLSGKDAFAAADIKDPVAPGAECSEDHRVIVDVVVPTPLVDRHQLRCSHVSFQGLPSLERQDAHTDSGSGSAYDTPSWDHR